MNKLLVFTNAERWNQLKGEFDVDNALWNARYNAIAQDQILEYGIDKGVAVLNVANGFSTGNGIYFVYDAIGASKLKMLLESCTNDNLYVLVHTKGVRKEALGQNVRVLKGNHDTLDNHYYFPMFDILTKVKEGDTVEKKMDQVIQGVFKNLYNAVLEFLSECSVPNKNLSESNAYNRLLQEAGLRDTLEQFKQVYDSSKRLEDYQNRLMELRDRLLDYCKTDG